jgi:Flp pilus assembly protein TadG
MSLFQKIRLFSERHRASKGTTAIEFALIAPTFFLLFIGLVEISLIMLAQNLLENATFNASRMAKTGYVVNGETQMQTVIGVLDTELGSLAPLLDVGKITMTSTAYGNLSQIGQPGQGTTGLGTAQQVVVYTVSYPWQIFTPIISTIIGDDNGIITLTSRIVVRNEPYN